MTQSLRYKITRLHFVLIAISLLLLGVLLSRTFSAYYLNNLRETLEKEARLAEQVVRPQLLWSPNIPEVELLAEEIAERTDARVTIIDEKGTVLGDSEEDARVMENHIDRPEVQQAKRAGTGTSTRFSSTLKQEMMYTAVVVRENDRIIGYVRLALPTNRINAILHRLWGVLGLSLLGTLLFSGLMSMYLSGTVTRPIAELVRLAGKIARGDLNERTRISGDDEIGKLAGALNRMAESLEEKVLELQTANNRLEAILKHMQSGVVVVDKAGRIILLNPRARDLFGIKEEAEVEGKDHVAVLRNYDFAQAYSEVLATGREKHLEMKLLNPRERIIEASLVPIKREDETAAVVAVLHDITELRRLERVRADFVANVSHELRTPVTAIRGFAETLRENGAGESFNEFIDIIYSEAERLQSLIDDLLTLSRLESTRLSLRLEDIDAAQLVRELKEIVKPQVQEKNLEFDIQVQGDVLFRADRKLIIQVLLNLINNAIKYTDPGGRITVSITGSEKEISFCVSDTGIGIPRNHLERIFERFYRVDKARSRERGGTGLGLAIVKHVVGLHGGSITVKSRPNEGSTFCVYLPKRIREAYEGDPAIEILD